MLQLFVLPPHKLPTGGKRTRTAGPTYERARFGRMPKVKFALDSPLEGSGFELSVPPGLGSLRVGTATANQYSEPRNGRSFYGGTNSSNPLPSIGASGESDELPRMVG